MSKLLSRSQRFRCVELLVALLPELLQHPPGPLEHLGLGLAGVPDVRGVEAEAEEQEFGRLYGEDACLYESCGAGPREG